MRKLFLIFTIILLTSCAKKHKFTDVEKQEAHLFLESIEMDIKSNKLSNSFGKNQQISENEMNEIYELRKNALGLAKQIPRNVLEKINSDLPLEFENYKKGLELRIDNFENNNPENEIKGSKLLEKWEEWYSANKNNIKIPKRKK